jgi:hypothetical protein
LARFVHFTHAPSAEKADDLEIAQPLALLEHGTSWAPRTKGESNQKYFMRPNGANQAKKLE